MSTRSILASLGIALALGACDDATRPEDPVWGKQACAHCAMLVSQPRYSAQLIAGSGDRYYFDDPGCMAGYVREHSAKPRGVWVRDASGRWIDARSARYHGGATTPMDYGFEQAPGGEADWATVQEAAARRDTNEASR